MAQNQSDPSTWQQVTYNSGDLDAPGLAYYDPVSGSIYRSQDEKSSILADKQALDLHGGLNSKEVPIDSEDPNSRTKTVFSLNRDPTKIQEDYQLYKSDPNLYYGELAVALNNTTDQVHDTTGMQNAQYKSLEDLKSVNPAAYWNSVVLKDAANAGFQTGHNGQPNAAFNAQLQADMANAKAAGIPDQQLNNIYNNVYVGMAKSEAENVASHKGEGGFLNGLPQFAGSIAALALAPELAGYLTPTLGAIGGGAATGAILGGATGGINAAATGGNVGQGILKGGAIGGVGGGVAGGIADFFNTPSISEQALADYANSTPDPILTMSELKSMSPSELAATLGAEGTSNFGTQAASKIGGKLASSTLASLLSGGAGAATGGTNTSNAAGLANALKTANQPVQEQFGGLYKMNQTPFIANQQNTTAQTTAPKTYDFLAELAKEGQQQPTLADLLRTA